MPLTWHLAVRKAAFEEMKRLFPELAHLVSSCYGTEAMLIYDNTIIISTRGFHQGDPLPSSWLAGNREKLIMAAKIILDKAPAKGLLMSTEITVPSNSRSRV